MLKKTIKTSKLIAVLSLFVVVAVIVAFTIKQAAQMNQLHAQMRDNIEAISDFRITQLNEKYPDGYTIYYSLSDHSGFYPINYADTLYDKFKMESWAVEISESDNSIRLLVPQISYSPAFEDIRENGWYLSGEIGSSITLTNPRLDPNDLGTIYLEIIDHFDNGFLFLIGQSQKTPVK